MYRKRYIPCLASAGRVWGVWTLVFMAGPSYGCGVSLACRRRVWGRQSGRNQARCRRFFALRFRWCSTCDASSSSSSWLRLSTRWLSARAAIRMLRNSRGSILPEPTRTVQESAVVCQSEHRRLDFDGRAIWAPFGHGSYSGICGWRRSATFARSLWRFLMMMASLMMTQFIRLALDHVRASLLLDRGL